MLAEFDNLAEYGCLDVGEGNFGYVLIILVLCISMILGNLQKVVY